MKTKGKPWQFFVVALLIIVFAYTSFFGISSQYGDITKTWIKGGQDIRFGIDIRGGVDVTFMPANNVDATDDQLKAAESVIQQRLVNLNITDNEVYTDFHKDRIIVRFPWKEGETEFNPEKAIDEIGATAVLTFREGNSSDADGKPTGTTAEKIILNGDDIKKASPGKDNEPGSASYGKLFVSLELNDSGKEKFAEATTRLAVNHDPISIWMDDVMISAPSVNEPITGGNAMITLGAGDTQEAVDECLSLANKINSGSLPFALSAESYSTISPSLGAKSLDAMVLAGIVAFILVAVFMTMYYRLPGFIASIALLGQTAATLAFVSGYFTGMNSFTLTLPGIAGIILAIGMGVDANVITAERIKEEMRSGKTLDGSIQAGFIRGLSPIIDGNVTVIIVAVMLMGAFGPTDGFFAKVLSPFFFAFGPSTAGTIYSFGYTLLVGVLLNFVFGIMSTRVMLKGVSKLKFLRKPFLYGGLNAKKDTAQIAKPVKEKKIFNIIGNRKKYYAFSMAVIVVILGFSAIFGIQMDIQFKGGAVITYGYQDEVDYKAVSADVEKIIAGSNVQMGSNVATGDKTIIISLPGSETVTTDTLDKLSTTLHTNYKDNEFTQLTVSNVDATIGGEFFAKSIVAVVAASLLILVYIAVRFKKIGGWPAGSMAVVALLHDLIVIFGVFVIMRIPLNGNFIAAVLTILGYSINDTVVIYDRIRENRSLQKDKKMPFEQLVNLSINQSLVRSLNTTVSTVIALGCVCLVSAIFGLDSIFTFAFPLIIGMVSGVYSTICIAGPLWVDWENHKLKRLKENKDHKGIKEHNEQ